MKKIFYAVLFVLLLAGLFGCKSNNNVSSEADMSNGKDAGAAGSLWGLLPGCPGIK